MPSPGNDPVRGILWMLAQTASFATMVACIRYISPSFSAFEIVFYRAAFGLVVQIPWLMSGGWRDLKCGYPGLILLRSLLLYSGSLAWFYAVGLMPISDAIALQFTLPLFSVLGAGLILGEATSWRRWAATAFGFASALVIIRPGFQEVTAAALIVLGSAALYAGVHLSTKKMSGEVSGSVLIFHGNLITLPLALIPALPTWEMPAPQFWPWLVAIGALGMVAHVFLTRAYKAADASIVAPADFTKLVFAAVLGWFMFNETSDLWTWVGAAMIFSSTLYITTFEARRARESIR